MNIFHILYNYVITIIFSKVGRNSKKKKKTLIVLNLYSNVTHTLLRVKVPRHEMWRFGSR